MSQSQRSLKDFIEPFAECILVVNAENFDNILDENHKVFLVSGDNSFDSSLTTLCGLCNDRWVPVPSQVVLWRKLVSATKSTAVIQFYLCNKRDSLKELMQAWVRWIDTHIKSIHMSKFEKYDVTSCRDVSIWLANEQNQLILSFVPPTPMGRTRIIYVEMTVLSVEYGELNIGSEVKCGLSLFTGGWFLHVFVVF